MTRAISLHDVSKTYARGVRVVDRLSLDIAPGEFLVLLGPSGCGKSTVLRMIAGLEEISEGRLLLDGAYANDLLPSERSMAMVFQNFALYPNMTTRGNIGFPLRVEDPQGDHGPRVDATARMLGIEDLLDRFPAQLSGGERQRVAMGRAISRHPSAFLMDEPLSNLDAKLRNHLRAEITRLTRELGVTTVYVTHDQSEAMSSATAWPSCAEASSSRWTPPARCTPCRATSSSPPSSAPRASTSCAAWSGPRWTAR